MGRTKRINTVDKQLTRAEQETVINFNKEDDFAYVFT